MSNRYFGTVAVLFLFASLSSEQADQAANAGRPVAWQGARSELARALAGMVRAGDVVLTVGAGDITVTGPELLALLGAPGVAA